MIVNDRIIKKTAIWNISNMLSMLRGFMTIPMAIALWHNNNPAVILIGAAAVVSDLLDGYLARKFNQVSEMGKIIDPIADKVFVGTAVLILILQQRMPLWFGIAVIARDLLILLGGVYATRKINYVIPSNYPGKITVLVLTLTLLGILLDFRFASEYGIYIALAALAASFLIYFINMIRKLAEARINS